MDKELSYAAPETIDLMASVIEAPELPLPTTPYIATGQLRIKLFINELGSVDGAELIDSSLPEDYSVQLLECFRAARFSPGMQAGQSVKSWRVIEINYAAIS